MLLGTLLALWVVITMTPVAQAFGFVTLPALLWVAFQSIGIGALIPLQFTTRYLPSAG